MKQPPHVVMLIHEYYPVVGGAQRQLALLAPLLLREGVRISVVTRHFPGLASHEVIDGVDVYRIAAPGPKVLASLSFMSGALRRILQLRPDVIHAYNLFSPLRTAIVCKRLLGTAVVVKVLRGGYLGDVDRLLRRRLGRLQFKILARQVDTFITISNEIDAELEGLGVPRTRRSFIPNGVDTGHFSPLSEVEKSAQRNRLGLPDGLLAVYAGRFVPEKRLDHLLAAWRAVRESHPTATLLLLGDGEEEERLRAQAGTRTIFMGRVDDVAPYLQTADLFVLPSATEGLSNSLLEAMATGLPAIATAVGGAPDLLVDGQNGRLVASDDTGALQQAIVELFEDGARRRSLGARARQKVVADYGIEVVAGRLCRLYYRLAGREETPVSEIIET